MPETSNDGVSRGELTKLVEDDINNNYAEWSMKSPTRCKDSLPQRTP